MPVFEGAFQNIVDYSVGAQGQLFAFGATLSALGTQANYGTTNSSSPNCFNDCGDGTRIVSSYNDAVFVGSVVFSNPDGSRPDIVPRVRVDEGTSLGTDLAYSSTSRFAIGGQNTTIAYGDSRFSFLDPVGQILLMPETGLTEQDAIAPRFGSGSAPLSSLARWFQQYTPGFAVQVPTGGGLCSVVVGSPPYNLGRCYFLDPVFELGNKPLPTGLEFEVAFFYPFDPGNGLDRTGRFKVVGYGVNEDANGDDLIPNPQGWSTDSPRGYVLFAREQPRQPA